MEIESKKKQMKQKLIIKAKMKVQADLNDEYDNHDAGSLRTG